MSKLRTLPFSFFRGNAPPVLSAVSSDLVDTAGGDVLTVLGQRLSGSTLQVSTDGVSWTSTTSTSSTSTTSTGTLPACAAGTVYLRTTGPGGTSNTLAIEAWDVSYDTAALAGFWDKGGYSVSTTGTWVRRFGQNNMTGGAGTSPADGGGYPTFNGTSQLLGASFIENNLQVAAAPYSGTVAMVVTPSATPAQSGNGTTGDIADRSLFGDNGRGAIGLNYTNRANSAAGVPGFMAVLTDGTYRTAQAPGANNTTHAVVMRFADKTTLDLSVDGKKNDGSLGVQRTAFSTYNTGTGQTLNIGSGYTTNYFTGAIRAVATLKEKATNKWLSKFLKWAAIRYSVGLPPLGAPLITTLSTDLVGTGGGTVVVVTGINLDTVTSVTLGGTAVTITPISSTSFSFVMPAKTPDIYALVATNAVGSSLALLIEAWDPSAISGIDSYLDSRKGVATSGANVTSWTEQTRTAAYTPVTTLSLIHI